MKSFLQYVLALFCCTTLVMRHSRALACDYCVLYQGIAPAEANGLSVRLDSRYLVLHTLLNTNRKVSDPLDQRETYFTTQFSAIVPLTGAASMLVTLPLTSRAQSSTGAGDGGVEPEPNARGAGIGDASALVRYRIVHVMTEDWVGTVAVSAGCKLATGSTNIHNTAGEFADAHMQLGTGSFDPLVAANFFAGVGQWGFTLESMAWFPGAGARGYRFGKTLSADLSAVLNIAPTMFDEATVFAGVDAGSEWHARETQDGAPQENTGGATVFLSPLVRVMFPHISIDANLRLPVLYRLNGEQLGETYRVAAGVQYRW